MSVRYLRFSLLVGVPDGMEPEAVETDLRGMIEDEPGLADIMPYNFVVSELNYEGDETK